MVCPNRAKTTMTTNATSTAWVASRLRMADDRPLVLLAPDQEAAQEFWDHLVRVGIDAVAGYLARTQLVLQTGTPLPLTVIELDGRYYAFDLPGK